MPVELARLLSPVPPWLVLAALLGVVNACACFLLVGRRVAHLAWYAILGGLAAGVGQVFGAAVQAPAPIQIGELNVLVASGAAWGVVLLARSAGL